ncbi:MAG: radical SAM protein [Desulfobacteraceae bacterium]|nr:MAG: radical SAM protein [Desulfobacteraceae bacterium]
MSAFDTGVSSDGERPMAHMTLVRPPALISRNTLQGPLTPPIGPAYLAGSLRKAGHAVAIVDAVGEAPSKISDLFNGTMLATGLGIEEMVERVPRHTDVIGISCMFSHEWPYIRLLIESLRHAFPSVLIVAGGEHITALPEFTLEQCPAVDLCVLGEGEETLLDVGANLKRRAELSGVGGLAVRDHGQIRRTCARPRIRHVDEIPWPAWDLIPMENYLDQRLGYGVDLGRSMPILATRGCPYQCTFCSSPSMWTTRYVTRKPTLLLDEIQTYIDQYGATNIDFYDLTAIIKKDWIIEFCRSISDRGLRFTWQLPSGTRSEAIDPEVSHHLFLAGCRNLTYAPESGSPTTLRRIKKVVKLDRMVHSMRGAVGNGVNLKANIIIGFPDETRSELWETMRFVVRMALIGVHDISISMFSPYPGSELYEGLRSQGKIKDLSDEYFLALAAYTDMKQSVSWSEHVSSKELGWWRLIGLLVFYGVQYGIRPWRLAHTLANVVMNRQESRLEKSIHDYFKRMFHSQMAKSS